MKVLKQEDILMINDYLGGKTVKDIAKDYDKNYQSLARKFRENQAFKKYMDSFAMKASTKLAQRSNSIVEKAIELAVIEGKTSVLNKLLDKILPSLTSNKNDNINNSDNIDKLIDKLTDNK
jgi:hypothetical protein